MKKVLTAFLAIGLSVPAIAFAQSAQQGDNDKKTQQQQNQAAENNVSGGSTLPQHQMSGMVSDSGKTFTSDNKSYIVNNPGSLKGYDNQSVSVVFQFDTDRNAIHIVSVSPPQAQ